MKIDAHQHFWSTQRPNDYGFLTPEAGVLYNDYYPEQLKPIITAQGIDYTVLVQAAETAEETKWLLQLVEQVDFVAGVVGWINFDTDEHAFADTLLELRQHPKFIAVRPMLQGLDDDRFILRPNVIHNLQRIAAEDFPFDILVYPKHLPYIHEMLVQVPGLRAVIDHLAKPKIMKQELEPWLTWMSKISKFPNVSCKLSGMVTEADHEHWKPQDFIPYVHGIVESFGPKRVMFGSDWPVCLLAASYEQVHTLLRQVLPEGLDVSDSDAIFGGNAANFYKLKI